MRLLQTIIARSGLWVGLLFGLSILVGSVRAQTPSPFAGTWALKMHNGSAGWLSINENAGQLKAELWTVGQPRSISNLHLTKDALSFTRKCKIGDPEYPGGPPTGERREVAHVAVVNGNAIKIDMKLNKADGTFSQRSFSGKRMPPLPARPDLNKIKFGQPIELFNGNDLTGWKLANSKQLNGWKAIDGALVNDTPKLDFKPWSKYGNLKSNRQFTDFQLRIDFKVPPGGNSGIYLRGVYEVQVVDLDSRMQGIQGVGAVFGRIAPKINAGRPGDQWQHYDITLVDRHVTIVLNGETVIENQPIPGCTNGAYQADETVPGPIYLQGDHTAVSYRNIVIRPVIDQSQTR